MRNCGRTKADVAGGTVIGNLVSDVIINNLPVAVVGDSVAGHKFHAPPVMASGSNNVFANGISVCRLGDVASCGHALLQGSPNVFVN